MSNPFTYDSVRINCPGTPEYDPCLPWLSVLDNTSLLATSLATYVDDERIYVNSERKSWHTAHQVSTRECCIGSIQYYSLQRRPPSQKSGVWAGSIIRKNNKEARIMVRQECCYKTRFNIRKLLYIIHKSSFPDFNTKYITSDRGFLSTSLALMKPWCHI